ncbi:hypothetical protein LCGC14_2962990 [marine sediment metagenome]|uniref:Uncharacterized protein n=1 Tax=marine sediment metagenome TaxID=412755 RepID=A0A0F9A2Y9_9ZZZZ
MTIISGLSESASYGILTEVAEKEKMRKRRTEEIEKQRVRIREQQEMKNNNFR